MNSRCSGQAQSSSCPRHKVSHVVQVLLPNRLNIFVFVSHCCSRSGPGHKPCRSELKLRLLMVKKKIWSEAARSSRCNYRLLTPPGFCPGYLARFFELDALDENPNVNWKPSAPKILLLRRELAVPGQVEAARCDGIFASRSSSGFLMVPSSPGKQHPRRWIQAASLSSLCRAQKAHTFCNFRLGGSCWV